MLIRNAEVWGNGLSDVLIEDGRIVAVNPPRHGEGDHPQDGGGAQAAWRNDENKRPAEGAPPPAALVPLPVPGRIVEANGCALLPGLHDHHIHLAALAARSASVLCGPPEVCDAAALTLMLQAQPGTGWLRGIGYHDSVMGLPSAKDLDQILPHRPLRIQHRSGRMWLLNSAALAELLAKAAPPPGLECEGGIHTGRLFDEDQWLRAALGTVPPDFVAVSATLASYGITGVTDMSPANDTTIAAHFAAQHRAGKLQQNCWLAGTLSLAEAAPGPWHLGPAKLHLHEAALPPFDEATAFITAAHQQNRAVAIHCVSEVELVFALAVLEAAGPAKGDRIEHASIASDELIARIAALGLHVCVQPQFVAERGDQYLRDVEPRHHAELYRLRAFIEAGVTLSGGSDAPFIRADPWAGMAAAVSRRTRTGAVIGADEALTPEQAVSLYLSDPADLTRTRTIGVGEPADLVLLNRPWCEARSRLTSALVCATIIAGNLVHQPPA
jgi:predicted amidohydrolase YtcJ